MAALVSAVAPHPPRGLKITGSNGKGSTCAMAASVLRAHGRRCGLYTSPHLYSPNERIQVDGIPISDDALESWTDRVWFEASRIAPDCFGAFELWTGVAAGWLSEQRVDAVVWEAGIGGRLDATRVLPAPVSAIVNVSLEHTALLGSTRSEIAADKAQLAAPGTRLVVGVDVPGFDETPARTGLPARLGLRGPHQRRNARVALAATEAWLGEAFRPDLAHRGLETARIPLRFERLAPDVVADVAHNLSGIEMVLATVAEELAGRPIVLLIGVSYDRPFEAMVRLASSIASMTVLTSARHKAAPADALAVACDGPHRIVNDVSQALSSARAEAAAIGGIVLVTGGLFMAAEAATALRGGNLDALRW